jgi:hypothetical protein
MATQFPKMGEYPLEGGLVNMSGKRSPYTMPEARKGPSGDAMDGPTGHRGVGPDATGEHNGPRFRPVTTIAFPNSEAASATGRGMRTLPSSLGNRDFWDSRTDGSGEVIA